MTWVYWRSPLSPTASQILPVAYVYVGATDLLPEVHSGDNQADRRRRLIGFLCGVLIVVPVSLRF